MNIITQNNHQDIVISKKISDFAKNYQIAQILRASNAYKHKGISIISIFLEVFATIFLHQTMYLRMTLHSEAIAFKKQTFFDISKKRRGRSKYLASADINIEKDGKTLPAKMVFVRNLNKHKEFLVLISTDMKLEPEEIVRIYGKCWGIEVFFKMCKSYLRLTKECRSLSYDGMTAQVSIVMTRYMMLSIEQRLNTDERSFGELFALTAEEMPDIRFVEALLMLQSKMEAILEECGNLEGNLISQLSVI